MQIYWTLIRRELASFFLSITGYVIFAATLFIMGFSFYLLLDKLQQQPTPLPITELWTPLLLPILVVTTPVITMRLFAQEKQSGTFETLMTAPVRDAQVVLAKFTAGLLFFAIIWFPLLACLLVVRHYSSDPASLDGGALASTFLGIFLLGGFFISAGCCASALTRSQVVAAMVSLVFGVSLVLLAALADHIPVHAQWQTQALAALALFQQLHDFGRGVVDTRPVILYLSLTFFFLFLTLRIIESRRWK